MTTNPNPAALPGRDTDVLVARKLGKYVVDEAWNCNIDPESGYIDPLPWKDPNFKEGDTGIRQLYHPVYLDDYWPILDLGDGKLGYDYGDGKIELVWPPQINKRDRFQRGPECYHLRPVRPYSTDWNAAMSLYELIGAKGCLIWLRNQASYDCGHECRILPGKNGDKMNEISKTATTGQMALCLAFLALPDSVLK